MNEGNRGVPVQAVIAALIVGKACDAQKEKQKQACDGNVVVSILQSSPTVCTCAHRGMAWEDEGDNMRILMSIQSLKALRDARNIDASEFREGNGPRFQYHPNDTNPVGGNGVHIATVEKTTLAKMIGDVVSKRLGVTVTVTVSDLKQMSDALDNAA